MSKGERSIGAAKSKQSDTEALCQPPPPQTPPYVLSSHKQSLRCTLHPGHCALQTGPGYCALQMERTLRPAEGARRQHPAEGPGHYMPHKE